MLRTALLCLLLATAAQAQQLPQEKLDNLDRRVTELERLKFRVHAISVIAAQWFQNDGIAVYDAAVGAASGANFCFFSPKTPPVNGVIDFFTGIPMTSGLAFSNVLNLGISGDVAEDLWINLELAAVQNTGDQNVGSWWGAPLPYLADPFTGNGGTGIFIHRFQAAHQDLLLELGAIRPEVAGPLLYALQESPRFFQRRGIDSFGIRLQGDHEHLKWEAIGTRLNDARAYLTLVSAEARLDRLKLRAGISHATDDRHLDEVNGSVVFWSEAPGPQRQTIYNAAVVYEPWENHTLEVEGSLSDYQGSAGSALRATFQGSQGDFAYEAEWMRIEPRFDPFLLEYPTPDPELFYVYWRFPDQSHQGNLYSLHATRRYPHNRQGWRARGEYRYEEGSATLEGGMFAQVEPSDYSLTTPGWFDAFFIPKNGAGRGQVTFIDASTSYAVNPSVKLEAGARRWWWGREGATSRSFIDLAITQAEAGVTIGEDVTGNLSLGYRAFQGHDDPNGYFPPGTRDTVDETQWVPSVTLTVPMEDSTWQLTYRHFLTRDHLPPSPFGPFSWSGGQLLSKFELKL